MESEKSLKEWIRKAELEIKKKLDAEIAAKNVNDPNEGKMQALLDEGIDLYQQQKRLECLSKFEQVIALGLSLKASEEANAAEGADSTSGEKMEVINLQPIIDAAGWMGKAFMSLKRPKEAHDAFKFKLAQLEKLRETPNAPPESDKDRQQRAITYVNTALCAKQSNLLDESLELLEKALHLSSAGNEHGVESDTAATIFQNMAGVYQAKCDGKRCVECHQKSLRKKPV